MATAASNKVPVLNPLFVHESIVEGRLGDTEKYAVKFDTNTNSLRKDIMKITTIKKTSTVKKQYDRKTKDSSVKRFNENEANSISQEKSSKLKNFKKIIVRKITIPKKLAKYNIKDLQLQERTIDIRAKDIESAIRNVSLEF